MAVRLAFTGNLAESIHRHLGPDPPARIEVAFLLRDKVVAIDSDSVPGTTGATRGYAGR